MVSTANSKGVNCMIFLIRQIGDICILSVCNLCKNPDFAITYLHFNLKNCFVMYMGEKTKKSLDENNKTSQVMKDLIFPYFPQS